ncbi:MupA/Atu3671 family FMN-dependent luciferase-like monooxygenase [Streptomyces xanthochromogenes]|uniref:Siderophore biosynthesis protein n=1 Tax=Streptomyces xanthochromogenes TaxID=67384 RepID=A0ABQ2ZSS9_9ACTN|nr:MULTISPECIES: MupA/Atu3671 family FMN-dependent luciferase-like monooxygenase [Streptomyces]MYV93428.1 LLM class flavin-dependent oxidoreductase [Streptomyces sp. SID1034]GGY23242.1 siderophore biosynthesis protein [Streptomyces xanthochromogenes]
MNADSRQTGSQGADGSAGERPLDFGVFFFAAVGDQAQETYRLMLDAARRADELGFGFVSTPERHFHRFGGAFPNPAVTSAAIAAVTTRIQIRAGSVVTPLHPAARIVEDFAMVDGISGGRVAISVGSGWNVNDFVIAPEKYETRREQMIKDVGDIRTAWRTGHWTGPNSLGVETTLPVYPRPVQDDLSVWVTASRSEGTFREAGRLGCNILTHLENQDVESLSDKIALYRTARAEAGWEGPGKITVMMHTYVADDAAEARATGGGSLRDYLLSAIDLEALAVEAGGRMSGNKQGREFLSAVKAQRKLAELGVNRYLSGNSLIGSVEECTETARRVRAAGVDEIACLVDFVADPALVLASLERVAAVRREAARPAEPVLAA